MRRLFFALPFIALCGMPACSCGDGGSSEQAEAGPEASSGFEASMPTPEAASEAGLKDATVDSGPGDAALDVMTFPPSSGGSGAFGVITVGGKQKMYLPVRTTNDAGNSVIAVVDVGIAGNGVSGAPALITNVDLGTPNYATTTGGTSSMVVAASTNSDDVWFIDPSTDKVVNHLNLGPTFGSANFSGTGGGFVTGIAADASTSRAYLSVWDGFAVVDLTTQALTTVIQAPPSENFGYDSVHQRILAPFYNCSNSVLNGQPPPVCNTPKDPDGGRVMGSGLSIIDLTDGSVFTYEDANAFDPANPLGGFPDSASADVSNQVYMVPSELNGFVSVLDFSKAAFDQTTLTVTAPTTQLTNGALTGIGFQGVAIESTSHIAFFASEGGHDVGVLSVISADMGNQGFVYAGMPSLPNGGTGFTNLGDPHGIAVGTLVLEGGTRPVGFVVDAGLEWVARVDLEMLQMLEQSDASVEAGAMQADEVVTYLDATTAE